MKQILLTLIITCLTAFAVTRVSMPAGNAHTETTFERILRTGIIRCGYAVWHPQLIKDPNSGALSGFDYEVMNLVGKTLGLKVEWVEEVGWGVAEQGLKNKRYDIACNSFWGGPSRTKSAFYSMPFLYQPLYAVIGKNTAGDIQNYTWLNQSRYRSSVIHGTVYDIINASVFPKSEMLDSFDLSTDASVLMDVATGKADFSYLNYTAIQRFLKDNPETLRLIDTPVTITRGRFLLSPDDVRLKFMIDETLTSLGMLGDIDKILAKYMKDNKKEWVSYFFTPLSGER